MEEKKYVVVGHCGYTDEDFSQEEIRHGTVLTYEDLAGIDATVCPMEDLHPLSNKVCNVLSCIECLTVFDCVKEVE